MQATLGHSGTSDERGKLTYSRSTYTEPFAVRNEDSEPVVVPVDRYVEQSRHCTRSTRAVQKQ